MDKNYLYAVANIRANELSLLSRADIDALILLSTLRDIPKASASS